MILVPHLISPFVYRRGNLDDLSKLVFAADLSIRTDSIEHNIIGMGHEFWIGIDHETIVAICVIDRNLPNLVTVMFLQVSESYKKTGVGSALLHAIMDSYPESEFRVVPLNGTREFYELMGFEPAGRWEMRTQSRARSKPS